jgi:hypothetical protein
VTTVMKTSAPVAQDPSRVRALAEGRSGGTGATANLRNEHHCWPSKSELQGCNRAAHGFIPRNPARRPLPPQ